MLKIYQLCKNQNTFEVSFKYKGVNVQVSFTDGNTYNGTPARCCTRDVFKQMAIESSRMFKEHEIILERTVKEDNSKKISSELAKCKATRASRIKPMPSPFIAHAVKEPTLRPAPASTPEPVTPVAPAPTPEPAPEDEGSKAKEMTFDNLGQAIVYIAQTFNVEAQTEAEVRKVLKENGITPHIKR